MAGEVLEHRHDARVLQTTGIRAGVIDDDGRVVGVGTVADHGVVGLATHVHVGREVDSDTELTQLLAPLECHLIRLVDGHGLRSETGRRVGAEEFTHPRHAAAFFVDRHHQRQRALRRDPWDLALRKHRPIGPAADEDAADLFCLDHRKRVVAPVTPTLSNCASF